MRIGKNPMKDAAEDLRPALHRVVVPVYIPSLEGYFEQALTILRYCLDALAATAPPGLKTTVFCNACTPEVLRDVEARAAEGEIDRLVVSARNLGKANVILSEARASYEQVLFFIDADVLLHHGWLEAAWEVLAAFDDCALVSLAPNPALTWYCTSSTLLESARRRRLDVGAFVEPGELDRFAASIGDPGRFREGARAYGFRHRQLGVVRGSTRACIGGGHFAFGVRREALARLETPLIAVPFASMNEHDFIEAPLDRLGYSRLAVCRTFADHLGNVPEPWMAEALARLRDAQPAAAQLPALSPLRRTLSALPAPLRRYAATALRRFWLERQFRAH